MKHFLIGIDGGASRSKCILTDREGALIATAKGGSLNPLTIGWDQFRENVRALLDGVLTSVPEKKRLNLCTGLAGTGDEEVRSRAVNEIAALIDADTIHVISDALAALWGAFQGEPGLLLIAGTGSICMGLDAGGNTARCGGFGRILGDEGSGYWIAVQAIRAALGSVDGRNPPTELVDIIYSEFQLNELKDIIPPVHTGQITPDQIAQIAPQVLAAAKSDQSAVEIVNEAAGHLADLVISTAQKLDMENPRVALWGGLWKSPGQELKKALTASLSEGRIACQLCEPAESAEWGAIRYLQKQLS
jgi:N-acetylglucosamine kinase-like BadF-type ATPase